MSEIKQNVYIGAIGSTFSFEKGEKIFTEISRKYNDEILREVLKNTPFNIVKKLTDSNDYFANYFLNR